MLPIDRGGELDGCNLGDAAPRIGVVGEGVCMADRRLRQIRADLGVESRGRARGLLTNTRTPKRERVSDGALK
jgi:hypothetical protein